MTEIRRRAPPNHRAMSNFIYIDPRGRRSGPYSEDELKVLARKGLLEPGGSVELEGLGQAWSVGEVPWLQPSLPNSASAAPGAPAPPPPPPDQTPPVAASAQPFTPPTSVEAAQVRIGTTPGIPVPAACSRTAYILLALLPPFVGVFGIHNIVAGYSTRGVIMLVLSLTTVFGIGCIAFPCTCVSVPVWIVLFTLSVIEAITVNVDAKGLPLS